MSSTTELGYPIWDPVGDDLNENVYSYFNSITGAQSTSAMRLLTADLNALNNTKLTIYSKAAADWAADSITVIKSGEFGIETDTGKIKFGNGVDVWPNLTYFSSVEKGDDLTVDFSAASSRTNISAGEKLSVMFGKIAKWFTDLKSVAWSGAYSDLSGTPSLGTLSEKSTVSADDISNSAVTNAKLANMAAKTVKGNLGTASAVPSDVTMLDVAEYALDAGTVATTVADAEYVPISVSETSLKKITWANIKGTLKTYFDTLYAALSHTHGSITNDGKIGTTANLPIFTGAGGTVETKTVAEARNTLGLGNTTGALPVENGGTGAVDAATARTNLGVQATMTPGTDYIPPSGGTMTGALIAKDSTDYTTAQVRNIVASTTDLTAGTSSLASGQVYLVYE